MWSNCKRHQPVLPQPKQISWHLSYFGPWDASMRWDTFEWQGVAFLWRISFSEFIGALEVVKGSCTVVLLVLGMGLGLATTHTLYFFVGMSFLILSVTFVSFLTWGLALGRAGLDWFVWGWNLGPSFPSNSRLVFIFLIRVGWGWSLVLQGLHLIIWHVLSLLNGWVPCMDVLLTSTSTISTGRWHLKNPCKKLHLGYRMHAI